MGKLLVMMLVIVFFSGCGFFDGFKKESREEKKILGYMEGYNPRIKDIEKLLKESGFNPGSIDGIMDKSLRKAIKEFQKANKIGETGFIDIKTKARFDALSLEKTKARISQTGPSIKSKKPRRSSD